MNVNNCKLMTAMILTGGLLITCATNAEMCVLAKSPVFTIHFGVETDNPDPDTMTTLRTGAHTDIEIPLRFFDWDVHINTAGVRLKTDEAFFGVDSIFRFRFVGFMPPDWTFTGAEANEDMWGYDQHPSPGFNSETMTHFEVNELCTWDPNEPAKGANASAKWLRVSLTDVRGPEGAYVSMWHETQGGTPIVFFSTYNDGITEADAYYITVNDHSHNSWGFTKPGLYEVDLQVSTYYRCDDTLFEDRNGDCFVNLKDFAILAAEEWMPNDLLTFIDQWLECGSPFASECP